MATRAEQRERLRWKHVLHYHGERLQKAQELDRIARHLHLYCAVDLPDNVLDMLARVSTDAAWIVHHFNRVLVEHALKGP